MLETDIRREEGGSRSPGPFLIGRGRAVRSGELMEIAAGLSRAQECQGSGHRDWLVAAAAAKRPGCRARGIPDSEPGRALLRPLHPMMSAQEKKTSRGAIQCHGTLRAPGLITDDFLDFSFYAFDARAERKVKAYWFDVGVS